MAKTYTVGPGTLTLGGTAHQAQIASAKITISPSREDPMHFLDGSSQAGETTYTGTLEAKVAQDLTKSGIVDYSWTNAGKTVAFVYTPNTQHAAKIEGNVVIDPIEIGGDVKTQPVSDISWTIPALPRFTPKPG